MQSLLTVAGENTGNLHCENRAYQDTSHFPQEVTNPNIIQEDKNAAQETI